MLCTQFWVDFWKMNQDFKSEEGKGGWSVWDTRAQTSRSQVWMGNGITTQRCGRSEWVNIYKIAFTELATWFLPSMPLGWKHRQHCQSSGKKLKQQRHFKGILSWWDYYYHKQLQNVPTHSPHQRYILPLCLPAHLCFGGYSNDRRLGTNSLS